MSTLPAISHHLFVAAAGQSRRSDLKPFRANAQPSDLRSSDESVRVQMSVVNAREAETARPLRVLDCATAS
jgi:hypothetical protein